MTEFYESQPRLQPIPQRRVIEKMDWYMSRRDYAGAERHLLYWLEEARQGGDLRGALMLRNELVGHYRKTGEREKALASGEAAVKLVERLDFGDTITAGTTYVNFATALNAFGENARALALFEKAKPIYESSAATRPELLGGLYNNMALACVALGRYPEAEVLYEKAIERMQALPHGALEAAITCLNKADLVEARDGMEAGEGEIYALVDRAVALLDDPALTHDGYYAFVCEKCASVFLYYGHFIYGEELKERARKIYEGS